ncbi:diiron oxygenase [Streptomyces sp. PKU-EA00015]|uniref:diiron oxygenase n=1 Tax=Streptomyces sp. PKU-EA00015 TaxID=2748326 RepID=UPI0015A0A200|nr:diiron oxygenase [Streptomyces sp. PKU-EA00015]NWF29771.1 diiron oxygenase [Streptomyces sp. PKU-EA00015]
MCGTVGMFVGCSALSYCPRSLLAAHTAGPPDDGARIPAGEEDGSGEKYRSAFHTWYERASVRQAPRRTVAEGDTALRFFSPDLVPVAHHPLVKALPEPVFDQILVQHLYRYLDFTAKLEYLVVNRTLVGIAHGSTGVRLPQEMRFDALKMYCDEAYHALSAVDLMRQVEQRTGIRPRLPDEPFFLRRLQQILAKLPADERGLAELLFVIVSETLISASLAEIPDSDGLVPAVRESIRDHAADEGRHHAYFAAFLRHLWGQLSTAERQFAGRLVPQLMDAFLLPDLESLRAELTGYGLSKEQVEQVVGEVYTPEVLSRHSRATSRMTRRYLDQLGAFDDPRAQAELHAHGYAS